MENNLEQLDDIANDVANKLETAEGREQLAAETNSTSKAGFIDFMSKIKNIYTPDYLDELAKKSYEEDREYPENFSNWYYHIKDFGNFAHADIISHQIFTFEESESMRKTDNILNVDWKEIAKILEPTLNKLDNYTLYNIKNGCFSNKFDFDTCLTSKEDLPKKLWLLNYQSGIFDTGGYTELIVREYIPEDMQHNLSIYNGMPLRTEVRVFYNMDTKQIEYVVDYWDYDYCSKGMHTLNDKLIFDIFHNKMPLDITNHQLELARIQNEIYSNIDTLKFDGELSGIWSIDFMYDKKLDQLFLIDMARGFRSAYWNPERVGGKDNE